MFITSLQRIYPIVLFFVRTWQSFVSGIPCYFEGGDISLWSVTQNPVWFSQVSNRAKFLYCLRFGNRKQMEIAVRKSHGLLLFDSTTIFYCFNTTIIKLNTKTFWKCINKQKVFWCYLCDAVNCVVILLLVWIPAILMFSLAIRTD